MTGRLAAICAHIPPSKVFADIGCDHGYCTKYALDHGLCERAYLSDVSAACLHKAETLLSAQIAAGRCFAVCADGLEGLPEPPDCVLCAGLGGEEIVRIFSGRELPAAFVLQPMKNTEKVRRFLIGRGAHLDYDATFSDGGKCYDLIAGRGAGGDSYSEFDYRYGRDNLKTPGHAFLAKIRRSAATARHALRGAKETGQRERLLAKLHELEGIADAIEEYL